VDTKASRLGCRYLRGRRRVSVLWKANISG